MPRPGIDLDEARDVDGEVALRARGHAQGVGAAVVLRLGVGGDAHGHAEDDHGEGYPYY